MADTGGRLMSPLTQTLLLTAAVMIEMYCVLAYILWRGDWWKR